MTYSAEPLPGEILLQLFTDNWNSYNESIPQPAFREAVGDAPVRFNTQNRGDLVVLRVEPPAEEETPIGNWTYGNKIVRILLEVRSNTSRQRLYDLLQEIRRICHSQMHTIATYHRIRYNSFNELTNEQANFWEGRIVITLERYAVLLET